MRTAISTVLVAPLIALSVVACGTSPEAVEAGAVAESIAVSVPEQQPVNLARQDRRWARGEGPAGGFAIDFDGPGEFVAPLPDAVRPLPRDHAVLVTSDGAWLHPDDALDDHMRFSIRVLDAATERPVPNAEVRLYRVRERNGDRIDPNWRLRVGPRFYPGVDGSVRVDVEEGERIALVARAPECLPVTTILDSLTGFRARTGPWGGGVSLAREGASATLWIGGGGRVSGRVFAETGEPLSGAVFSIAPPDSVSRNPASHAYITNSVDERFFSAIFTADVRGCFVVRGLPTPGRYAIFAGRAQHATGRSADVTFLPGTHELTTSITLEPTADLRVFVTDDRDEPVEGAWVSMDTSWGQATATRTTDTPIGHSWFDDVMPGPVRLRVNAPGLVGVKRDIQFDGVGETEVVVALRRGATLTGRVTGPGGVPVAGIEVRFASGGTERTAKTDAEGRYELEGLPEAKGVVQIFSPAAYRSYLARGVTIADSPYDITLTPLSSLRGRLDPRPECGTLLYIGPGGARSNWKRRTIDVAADGTFVVEGIDGARAFDLLLWPGEGACHVLRGTRITPGEMLDVGTLDGSPAARVWGRVVDASGAPLAGATVYLEQFPVAQDVRTRSDAEGKFELPFAVDSPGVLVVEAAELPKTHYALTRDPERTALELCVHPGGTVVGTLPATGDNARHSAYIEFRDKRGPGRWVAKGQLGLRRYEIRLPAGAYTSRVRVPGRWIAGDAIVVTEGEETVLSIGE